MCLIALANGISEKYKLIIAANRDEFLARPAAPADWWDGTDLLAGKDLQANGTWLGITRSGRFAAITNYRDLVNRKDYTTSRGSLISGFLLGKQTPVEYLEYLRESADDYDGYNIIFGYPDELHYFSNKEGEGIILENGLYLLSNHLLNTPWFKAVKFRSGFEEALKSDEDITNTLLDLLLDEEKSPAHLLPSTGLPFDVEKEISSVFIRMKDYGTRCSTVITVGHNNHTGFTEVTHTPERIEKNFQFDIMR
ncbi:MAG: NRDE family protein [Ignavibacteriaceae bacterium]|nr:NRDE family protein [Ignavibacteriaceae bacterium]